MIVPKIRGMVSKLLTLGAAYALDFYTSNKAASFGGQVCNGYTSFLRRLVLSCDKNNGLPNRSSHLKLVAIDDTATFAVGREFESYSISHHHLYVMDSHLAGKICQH